MGQCVSSSRSVLPPFCAPVPLEGAVDLPAPPADYLNASIPLPSDLTMPVPTTSTTPVLSPDMLRQVYQRALYLYRCPISTLSWKCVTYSTGIHCHSQLTCEVTEASVQPASSVRLQPSDHLIRPSPEWFPALLELCSTLHITVHFPSTPTPAVIPEQHYPGQYSASSPSLPALLCFVPHLIAALSIYPPAFFHRLDLRELWLCDSLTCNGVTAWMASFLSKRLYVDCALIDSVHVKSLIHHELFHFIDYAIHHSPSSPPLPHPITRFCAVPDPAWAALNDPSFRYGDGGLPACSDTESAYTGRVRGRAERGSFPSRYAQSGMEEDRAEVWAALVRDRHSITHARDGRLRQKGAELERRVKEWSGGLLDEQWWQRTQKAGGGANFSHTRHERTVWGRLTKGRWVSITNPKGAEYWYNHTTKQSVVINPNVY